MGRTQNLRLCFFFTVVVAAVFPAFSESDKELSNLYFTQARQVFLENQLSKAEGHLRSSLTFNPDNSDSLYLLSRVSDKQKDTVYPQIDLCNAALSAGQWRYYSEDDCIRVLTNIYRRIGEFQKIVLLVGDKIPEDPVILENFCISLMQTGSAEKALTLLRSAVEVYPENPDFKTILIEADYKYREELAEEYLKGFYPFNHRETVLLSLIRNETSETRKQELLEYYFSHGGENREAYLEAFILKKDRDYLNKYFQSGGIKDSVLMKRFNEQLLNEDFYELYREEAESFSGDIVHDSNRDGFAEIVYTYRNGEILRIIYDADQDGIKEYDIQFEDSLPKSVSAERNNRIIQLHYRKYPFGEKLILSYPDVKRTYFFKPERFRYPFIILPQEGDNWVITKPRLQTGSENIDENDLIAMSGKIEEKFIPEKEVYYTWEAQADGEWLRLEKDQKNRVLRRIYYRDFQPVSGSWDADLDGIFDFALNYEKGEIIGFIFMGDEKNMPGFSLQQKDERIQKWDFNNDGMIDCRETFTADGGIKREYSTQFDGIFDLILEYKDKEITSVKRIK